MVGQVAEPQAVEGGEEQDRQHPPRRLVDRAPAVEVAVDGLVHQRPVRHGREHVGGHQPGGGLVAVRQGNRHAEQHDGFSPTTATA